MKLTPYLLCFAAALSSVAAHAESPHSDPFAVGAKHPGPPSDPIHLEPLPAYDPDGYDQAVFRSLIGADPGELWMIGKPSFKPEYAVIAKKITAEAGTGQPATAPGSKTEGGAEPQPESEARGPFYSPVTGFSNALIPVLTGFEEAKVETTLRGFIARADSFPGFRQSAMEPSELGIYLNVAVRDAVEVKVYSDRSERQNAFTHRLVQIPPPPGGEQAIVIQFDYGSKVSRKVIEAIARSITGVIEFSKRGAKQ